jgi:hypothetical protein
MGPLVVTTCAGWASRVVAAVAQFGAIRLLTDSLGIGGYSAFAVITGLLAWFMLADLGFGAAVQNYISHARVDGADWQPVVRRIVGRLSLTLVILWLATAGAAPWAGPYLLADYKGVSTRDAMLGFGAFGILMSATGVLSIMLKIQFAQHRGYLAHIITGVSAAAGLLLLAIVLTLPLAHLLVWAIVAYYLPGVLLPLLLLVRLVRRAAPARAATPRFVAQQAGVFLLFAALSALVLNVDYIILARTVTPRELLLYAIVSKVYALI